MSIFADPVRRSVAGGRGGAAGIGLVDGAGLTNTSQGKRVAFDGASCIVIDGPFAETREIIAGYAVWEVKDMDEAVAWVKRWPNPVAGSSEIEIRPLFEWQPTDDTFSERVLFEVTTTRISSLLRLRTFGRPTG